jgi:hypothetical protein
VSFSFTLSYLSLCVVAVLGTGCTTQPTDATDIQIEMTLEPSPPMVGNADVAVRLADANGSLLPGAQVRLEGNMNHAGMKPSFADLSEVAPGHYAGTLNFTMSGDWFLLISATTADGMVLERKIDVPGVRSN